jgi:hypothetical protein
MNTPRLVISCLATLLVSQLWAATVWKWVDKNGVVHYSDQPVPGAIQVDLNVQTFSAQEADVPQTNRSAAARDTAAELEYQSIAIASPGNDETLSGTGGAVTISVTIEPALQGDHSVGIYLDGRLVSEPQSTALSAQVSDVGRGAHTAQAQVLGADGRVLIQSAPVTFFVFQQSVMKGR